MNEIKLREITGDLAQFEPRQTRTKVRQLDALIAEAAALRDWKILLKAAEFQVAEQIKFVQWWTKEVSVWESQGSHGRLSSPDLRSISMKDVEDATNINHQRVARWRKSLGMVPETPAPSPEKIAAYEAAIIAAARKLAGWEDEHLAFDAGNDEWCTPPEWIDLARSAMGGITLDPCTSLAAQARIQAKRYFTKDDDALTKRWNADSVWLNPPYSRDAIGPITQKLLGELDAGRTAQATVLVNAATSSDWFQRLFKAAALICLPETRIRFLKPDGSPADGSPPIGQTFFYFGADPARFSNKFAAKGVLARMVPST